MIYSQLRIALCFEKQNVLIYHDLVHEQNIEIGIPQFEFYAKPPFQSQVLTKSSTVFSSEPSLCVRVLPSKKALLTFVKSGFPSRH